MTYRVYARPKQDDPFSSESFKRSAAIATGREAVDVVLAMEVLAIDVFIHCEQTDQVYERQEMMVLTKE